jgi:hypothetical protein
MYFSPSPLRLILSLSQFLSIRAEYYPHLFFLTPYTLFSSDFNLIFISKLEC